MGFGERTEIKETTSNKSVVTENNFDKQPKYTKPELQEFHNTIIKDYPQTNEKNLQNILLILDKDTGNDLLTKGFDAIKKIIDNDKTFLSTEKSESELQRAITIIKDEIGRKDIEEDTEKTQKEIKEIRGNINKFSKEMPDKYKDYSKIDKFTTGKETVLSDIKGKLDKSGSGIDINDYVKNRYTAVQLSQDNEAPIPNKVEFIKEFNKLNKLLDIDIEIPVVEAPDFMSKGPVRTDSLDDLEKNGDEVLGVKSIKEYVKTGENAFDDESFEKIDISDENILKIYDKKDIQKSITTALQSGGKADVDIGKYFDKGVLDTKKLKKEVDKDTNDIINRTIAEMVKSGKNTVKETTNTTIKERIITNVFKGLSGYFDTTNVHEENFAEDFKLNIQDDISMDGQTVNLNGTINGHNVGFYYDLETGKLQMDDVVHLDQRIYKIGQKNGGKFTLPTQLPTYAELTSTAKETDINEILKSDKVSDITTYQSVLKDNLDDKLSQDFSHKELNKYYIEKYNEKNLAMQENLGYIFNNLSGALGENLMDFNKTQEFAIETKPNQYQLFWIMDQSLDYYNQSGQYLQFRDAFEKFNALINTDKIKNPDKGCQEPLINELFNRDSMKKNAENRKNIGSKEDNKINYTTFYEMISNDLGIIDLGALEKINTLIEKDETIEEHDSFSSEFRDKYKVRKADTDLKKELTKI